MRRTQLYLDDHLWKALHAQARTWHTAISELVRRAVRERHLNENDERRKAMEEFVGVGTHIPEPRNTAAYVRALRRGNRLERLHDK